MNDKFLEQLKSIYTKLGGTDDLTAENSLIVILEKIYYQMGGDKNFKEFSLPEAIDFIEDEVGGGGGGGSEGDLFALAADERYVCPAKEVVVEPAYIVGENRYHGQAVVYDDIIIDDYIDGHVPTGRFKVGNEYMGTNFRLDEHTVVTILSDSLIVDYTSIDDPGPEVIVSVPEITLFCAKQEVRDIFGDVIATEPIM